MFIVIFQTKRLFGHPNLIILPKNIRGKDVYSFIAKLLPEPLRRTGQDSSSPPFTLHLVDQQVSGRIKIKDSFQTPISCVGLIDTLSLRHNSLVILYIFSGSRAHAQKSINAINTLCRKA